MTFGNVGRILGMKVMALVLLQFELLRLEVVIFDPILIVFRTKLPWIVENEDGKMGISEFPFVSSSSFLRFRLLYFPRRLEKK